MSIAAIQASVMEKLRYEISCKKALDGKHKAPRHLFGDFSQSYKKLPRLFLALEQANPGCVVIWKTSYSNMPNTKIFQLVFWSFKPSIEGFEHCHPETHTFHVPIGEMTATLQDVAIILGLRIHRPTVAETFVFNVAELCGELLGVTPPIDALRGSSISIWWLCDQLSTPAPDVDEVRSL